MLVKDQNHCATNWSCNGQMIRTRDKEKLFWIFKKVTGNMITVGANNFKIIYVLIYLNTR